MIILKIGSLAAIAEALQRLKDTSEKVSKLPSFKLLLFVVKACT
jgi:hypothetical protein